MIYLTEQDKIQMFEDAKNLWLSALFGNISGYYPNITFEKQKEIFFTLVEEGLKKGFIKFDYPPLAQYANKKGVWEADNKTIMQYLKDNFPKNATNELDSEVNFYFYLIAPPVNWLS